VDVGVHADPGLAEAERDDEVGRLAADALQREQGVDVVRHAAVEALEQITTEPPDDARLRPVEADGIDQTLDGARGQRQHGGWRVGDREQARRRRTGGGVLSAERQDAGHQHAERIAIALRDHRQRRPRPAAPGAPQLRDDAGDV
jgi:hypothetical protein